MVKKKKKKWTTGLFIELHEWVICILCLCLFTSQSQSTVSASANPRKLLWIISPMAFYLSELMNPSSGTLVAEFSALLNTAHASWKLALPLSSMTSLRNYSPAISTAFLSRVWSLVPLLPLKSWRFCRANCGPQTYHKHWDWSLSLTLITSDTSALAPATTISGLNYCNRPVTGIPSVYSQRMAQVTLVKGKPDCLIPLIRTTHWPCDLLHVFTQIAP